MPLRHGERFVILPVSSPVVSSDGNSVYPKMITTKHQYTPGYPWRKFSPPGSRSNSRCLRPERSLMPEMGPCVIQTTPSPKNSRRLIRTAVIRLAGLRAYGVVSDSNEYRLVRKSPI